MTPGSFARGLLPLAPFLAIGTVLLAGFYCYGGAQGAPKVCTELLPVGLLTRGLILAAALVAVGIMLLTMLRFLRKPELMKAKLFLNYASFSRRFLLIVFFAFGWESFTWLSTLAGLAPAPTFESWDGFFRNQTVTMVVAVAAGVSMVWLWRKTR